MIDLKFFRVAGVVDGVLKIPDRLQLVVRIPQREDQGLEVHYVPASFSAAKGDIIDIIYLYTEWNNGLRVARLFNARSNSEFFEEENIRQTCFEQKLYDGAKRTRRLGLVGLLSVACFEWYVGRTWIGILIGSCVGYWLCSLVGHLMAKLPVTNGAIRMAKFAISNAK